MDASYYVDGALSLYDGRGFNDPFIWNYLDDPAGIPHPSHLYWMPMSSILAYLSFLVFGPSYRAAQAPFVLLSSLLPAVSYLVAYDVAGRRRHAVVAALLTIFSGFYMRYWVTPDNFAPFAVAGALCLWACGRGLRDGRLGWFALAGLCAGLGHLSRADGVLLAVAAGLAGIVQVARDRAKLRRALFWYAVLVGAYLLVMGPWFVRNWLAIGRPLSTAGMQTVWLTDYDDLFSYGKVLNLQTYLSWGWSNILRSKLRGLWLNLQTVLFVGWMVFLAAFGLLGAWRLRRRVEFRPALLYLVILYLALSLVFTFAGWRGGMLHSTVALLPTLFAAAMEGLDAAVAWAARRRPTWRPREAQQVFAGAFVLFAVVLSVVLYARELPGAAQAHPYARAAAWLDAHASPQARAMVNDPATFYYHGRRECVAIPNAGQDTVLQVMRRYGIEYLVLDANNPTLSDLIDAPQSQACLQLLEKLEGAETTYLFGLVC